MAAQRTPPPVRQDPARPRPRPVMARRRDLVVILGLAALALVIWLVVRQTAPVAEETPRHAEVWFEDRLLERIPMVTGEPRDFHYDEAEAVVLHRDAEGRVAFVHSDCPDQICVRTGFLALPGRFAACLPRHMLLTVVADEEAGEGSLPEVDYVY